MLRFSVVIPCFNQGRFLTDCLESLAVQSRLPDEALVVNDGSTDPETLAFLDRLPRYSYPFPVRVFHIANSGPGAARNHGIRECAGDVIVPLDSDDILLPQALEAYERFLTGRPEIDICYPNIVYFGNYEYLAVAPDFNRWRLTRENLLFSSSAIRRRVFDGGYWYRDDERCGYEDWEFYIRACALGPFRAAPVREVLFGYRYWGFSRYSAVRHEELAAELHDHHTRLGIWSSAVERDLRTRLAPSHRMVGAAGAQDDLAALDLEQLDFFLQHDAISRYLWWGAVPRAMVPSVQVLVNEASRAAWNPCLVFFQRGAAEPYLLVVDRLALWKGWLEDGIPPTSLTPALRVQTEGTRFIRTVSLRQTRNLRRLFSRPDLPACFRPGRRLLPEEARLDTWLRLEMAYYFRRKPAVPCPRREQTGGGVLVIALPSLSHDQPAQAVLAFLQAEQVRRRFDQILLLTFQNHDHPAHGAFEPWLDGLYHLGNLGIREERKAEIARQILERSEASDFWIVNCRDGLALIPPLRQAKLPVHITVQLHECGGENLPHLLASRYAVLVDRVAVDSCRVAAYLSDLVFFPSSKIKTIYPGVDQNRYAGELLDWLFSRQNQPVRCRSDSSGVTAA